MIPAGHKMPIGPNRLGVRVDQVASAVAARPPTRWQRRSCQNTGHRHRRLMHHTHICQTSGDSIRLTQAITLDFRCYAAASSQARRMAWISSGVGWSG